MKVAGIVGLGSIGARYAELLDGRGIEVHVYSTGRSAFEEFRQRKRLQTFTEREEFLASGLDVVFICNPTFLHKEWIEICLGRGLPIYCEKPVHWTRQALNQLDVQIQHHQKIPNAVGYMWRYDDAINRLKELIWHSDSGRIISASLWMRTHLPSWHPWEDYSMSYAANREMGGGVTLTCSHEIDTLRYLFGELSTVGALTSSCPTMSTNTDDCVMALLQAESGAIINLDISWAEPRSARIIEIFCERRTMRWDQSASTITVIDVPTGGITTHRVDSDVERNYAHAVQDFLERVSLGRNGRATLAGSVVTLKNCLEVLGEYE